MPTATERLALIISADGTQAIREFEKTGAAAQTSLRTAQQGTDRLGTNLVRVGAGMAAFGAVALVGFGKAAQAAQEEDRAILALNNSISNSPELAGASADAFLEQAAALQETTKFADDATISAQAMLGTFHLTQDEILGLTPLVQDLASKFDLDLNRASILVGKAMDGSIGTLQRMGVRIDAATYATDRYSAVTEALRENAGGFAAQEGATMSGRIAILKNRLGDLEEGVGRGAVQAFDKFVSAGLRVVDVLDDISPGSQAAVGEIGTFAAVGLVAVGSATMLAGSLLKIRAAYVTVKAAAAEAAAAEGAAAAASGTSALAMGGIVAAAAAATVGVVALARAADGLHGDIEALSQATTDQMADVAEAIVAFGDGEETLSALFDIDPAAADRFLAAVRQIAPDTDEARAYVGDLEAQLFELNRSAELSALGLDDTATSAEELSARMDALNKSIDNYLDRVQGVEEAAAAEAEAQQALFEALIANGHTFDVNTEAGRENIAMRNSWVDTVAGQVQAAIEHGNATGNLDRAQRQANAAIRNGIGDLRAMRDAGLITAEQFRELKRTMENIPHQVSANVTSNVSFVRQEFDLLAGSIANAGAVAASHSADFHMAVPGRAHGGVIREGEAAVVHGGEVVTQRGGTAVVTPAGQVRSGPVELSDSSIRRLAKEMAMVVRGPQVTLVNRG